jgi:hypothetical protein
MGQGDHTECPVELRACPEHQGEQPRSAERESDKSVGPLAAKDSFDEMLAQLEDPEYQARMTADRLFLESRVFQGLNSLSPAFDSPLCAHFHSADFLEVIARCTALGIRINGLEVFTPEGGFLTCEFGEGDGNSWCIALVKSYDEKRDDLHYCASYSVPDSLMGRLPYSSKSVDQGLETL